jgi:crotonobetainyl-CoA:carnitine CoA-transferase CaiB-like acyl-CoA transferase
MAARERASISSGIGGSSGPLAGVRVLDLTTPRAELAGRLLSDLGADVLKIEPVEGSSSRLVPPFEGNRAGDIEASLYWAAVALGKKSAVLDFRSPPDRRRLRDLATRSDILLESFDPGTQESLGLGPDELCEQNPRLIYVSVTPYGQWGPKAHWPATELTIEAAGGRVALQGDRDRVPLPVGYPQAAFHAGAWARAGIRQQSARTVPVSARIGANRSCRDRSGCFPHCPSVETATWSPPLVRVLRARKACSPSYWSCMTGAASSTES